MATYQDVIDLVKGNLGNRSGGKIGSLDTDTAVLKYVNEAIRMLGKKFPDIESLERTAEVTVTTAKAEYALPHQDTSGSAIVIAEILAASALITGETHAWGLERVTHQQLRRGFPALNSNHQGRISIYSLFNEKIIFAPYPVQNYTVTLSVYTKATEGTDGTKSTTMDIGETWFEVIESYATAKAFGALQQFESSVYWMNVYNMQRRETIAGMRKNSDMDIDTRMGNLGHRGTGQDFDIVASGHASHPGGTGL